MSKQTAFMKAADKAHAHLNRGFETALDRFGRVPIGNNPVDPRTARNLTNINMPFTTNLLGMTAGLPLSSRRPFQKYRKTEAIDAPGQTEKNKLAGLVVDPSAHEAHATGDSIGIDTASGYGST